jgi:hypothetical protein
MRRVTIDERASAHPKEAESMQKIEAEKLLRRVRLELARDHEFPNGSRERGYDFVAPLDANGRIVLGAWKDLKERCRVRRFWAHAAEEVGHAVHKSGGAWAFHYDIHGDPSRDERASASSGTPSTPASTCPSGSRAP